MLPFDFLRKKRQRGHDGVALDAESDDDATATATATAPPSPRGSDGGAAESDSGDSSSSTSSSGGGAGCSLPHLGNMAAADILDSYMRELLHNTIPCLGGCGLVGAGWWVRDQACDFVMVASVSTRCAAKALVALDSCCLLITHRLPCGPLSLLPACRCHPGTVQRCAGRVCCAAAARGQAG